MISIKILDRKNLIIKKQWQVNDVEFGVDLITDESYQVTANSVDGINVGDILQIIKNKISYFHTIDKIVNNDLMYKSILEIFNTDVYEPNTNITLYNFIENHFINEEDVERNFNWLDTSAIFKDYKIAIDLASASNSRNAKEVIKDTIFARKAIYRMELVEYTTNVKLKLIIEPQSMIYFIKLSKYTLQNLITPKITKSANYCDVWLTKTRQKEITAKDGSTSSITEVVSVTETRYYLLKDNTITTNKYALERVKPAKGTIIEQTYAEDEEEPPVAKDLASDELLDTTSYYWSFDMLNNREIYLFDINLGDLVDIGTDEGTFRSVVTGITYLDKFTTYKFGFNRIDLIFELNNLKKGT
jgi:hypothetical protein